MYERRVVFKDNCRRFFFSAAADPSERRSSADTRGARGSKKIVYKGGQQLTERQTADVFKREKATGFWLNSKIFLFFKAFKL
jgi:hypothetical protein